MPTRTADKYRQGSSHWHDRKDSIDRHRSRHHDTAFDGQKNHLDLGFYVHRAMVRHDASGIVRGNS